LANKAACFFIIFIVFGFNYSYVVVWQFPLPLALLLVRFAVDVFSFGKPGLGAF
jgi:hypothetical protein